jgi:hypothetical protein
MKLSWRQKPKNDSGLVPKLINYIPEQNKQINEVSEATDYNFTEVQKLINEFFFSDEDHLDEVFGEEEDEEEDEDTD